MALGNNEKESLKSLVKSCLLEINRIKTDMTIIEKEKSLMCSDEDFNRLNNALDTKEKALVNKENELVFLKEEHAKEITKLNEDHSRNITQLKEEHAKEITKLNEDHSRNITQLKEEHAKEITKLNEDHSRNITELEGIIDEKEKIISNQEDNIKSHLHKITDLNVLKDSLLDIRKALKEDFNEFKSSEIDKHNEKIQEYLETIVKKDFEIVKLNDKLQQSQLAIRDLENNIITKDSILELENELKKTKDIICKKDNEINLLKGGSVPKDDLLKVRQEKFENETLLSQKDDEISRLKEETISKKDYLKLQEDLAKKESQIKHLEEVNQLFSDMEYSDVLNQSLLNNLNSLSEDEQLDNIKEELINAKLSIKELETIKQRYDNLIASPKPDLTYFQSQIYNLIPEKPMTALEIHKYIKNVAFDKLTLNSINNIIKNFLRKGYIEIKEDDDENPIYIKINK